MLPHCVIGDFGKPDRAAAGKQRNPERHRAEPREKGSDADLELSRTLIIGAPFIDVILTAAEFVGVLIKLPGHDNLPCCFEVGLPASNIEVRDVTA